MSRTANRNIFAVCGYLDLDSDTIAPKIYCGGTAIVYTAVLLKNLKRPTKSAIRHSAKSYAKFTPPHTKCNG
jgi:hypothetical protein